MPLREHHGGDAVDDVERRRHGRGDEVARAAAPLLLLVRELEDPLEPRLVELSPGRPLEERDEPLELGGHQVEARGSDDLLPVVGDPLPPAVGQHRVDRLLEREERNAALALPRLGDAEVRVRPDLGDERRDRRQPAPRRLLGSSSSVEPSEIALYCSMQSG